MDFPMGGGHLWVYLNWALGLRALGCDVVWLEPFEPEVSADAVQAQVKSLRSRLEPYGLADSIAVCPKVDELPADRDWERGCIPVEEARDADLLLNIAYYAHVALLPLFRRTALVDIDPALLQMWVDEGLINVPPYGAYFTTGETVGRPGEVYSGGDVSWQYAPANIALDWWPVSASPEGARFTTVSSWYSDTWYTSGGEWLPNNKSDGFRPFLDLPKHTPERLELALALGPDEDDTRADLRERGWLVIDAADVSSTPGDYQRYIQGSRGEFSCAKPSCAAFQNAWVSDRTLAYLASGKPAVVEYTGPSRILPDAEGLFRFRTVEEAVRQLETAAADPEHHGRLGRALVEEHFDAKKVVARVLERALA
jgi:hypothetical protein